MNPAAGAGQAHRAKALQMLPSSRGAVASFNCIKGVRPAAPLPVPMLPERILGPRIHGPRTLGLCATQADGKAQFSTFHQPAFLLCS